MHEGQPRSAYWKIKQRLSTLTHRHTNIYIYTHICTLTYTYIYTHMHNIAHIHIQAFTQTCIHTDTQKHIHTHRLLHFERRVTLGFYCQGCHHKISSIFTHYCMCLLIDWTVKISCTQENVNFNLIRGASEEK